MTDEAFWQATLYEIDVLSVRYRRVQARADRRAALPAWLLANVNRDSQYKHEPFTLEEVVAWLGHGFQDSEPQPSPTQDVESMKETVHMLNALYDGKHV